MPKHGKQVDPVQLLQLIEEVAVQAGRLARSKWSEPLILSRKGFRDIVTDADVATQQLITKLIRRDYPEHGFLTEEDDSELPADGPIIWIIDPIDGTTNYSRQLPTYCVSIAAVTNAGEDERGGQVLAGAVYDPMRDELFAAARGNGATVRMGSGQRRPLQVSPVGTMSEVLFGLDWSREPELRTKSLAALGRFAHEVHTIRAIGAAALALAWIAAGRLDGYLNYNLSPWDVAAGQLLIQEAGGQLCQASGRPWSWRNGSSDCLASNGLIHQELISLVGGTG